MAKQTLNNGETGLVHRTKLNENFTELYNDKQDNLVSGTNIKTINGESIVGSGNLVVGGGDMETSVYDPANGAKQVAFSEDIITDHGGLGGLADDDHTQYHNDTRGDIRYYTKTEADTLLSGKISTGGEAGTVNTINGKISAGTNVTISGSGSTASPYVINSSGGAGYTDEQAQDAVGSILTDSTEIDFTYDDATPSITASLKNGSIDEAKLDSSINASLDLADSAVQPGGALGTPSSGTLTNCTFPTLNQDTTGKSASTDALKSATTTVNVSSATAPTAGQVLTATDSTHATWQTPSSGGGYDYWQFGSNFVDSDTRLVVGNRGATNISTTTTTANRVYYIPFQYDTDVSILALGYYRLNTTAGDTVLGIYSDNNYRPLNKLVQSIALTTTTVGYYEDTGATISLTKGTKYWACVATSHAGNMRGVAVDSIVPILGNVKTSNAVNTHYYETLGSWSTTLPSTVGTLTTGIGIIPGLYIKV